LTEISVQIAFELYAREIPSKLRSFWVFTQTFFYGLDFLVSSPLVDEALVRSNTDTDKTSQSTNYTGNSFP